MFKLTDKQIEGLANIFSDFGVVMVGSVVLPIIISDSPQKLLMIIGGVLTCAFWTICIILLKYSKPC